MSQPVRIAMWSGPRNISTAMMRAWENRGDTWVADEPLYAHYLKVTGIDHPGRDEVIAAHESDWRRVVDQLTGPLPAGAIIHYQKHMAHHLLPEIERGWLARLTHAFLIREPREMLTSLIKVTPRPTLSDTGLPQQVEILDLAAQVQKTQPPIIDARDVLENPRRMLGLLCDALTVPFRETMLAWPAGCRPTDGVWARHWYAAVEKSTGFEPYQPKNESVPAELGSLLDACERYYQRLHTLRIR